MAAYPPVLQLRATSTALKKSKEGELFAVSVWYPLASTFSFIVSLCRPPKNVGTNRWEIALRTHPRAAQTIRHDEFVLAFEKTERGIFCEYPPIELFRPVGTNASWLC